VGFLRRKKERKPDLALGPIAEDVAPLMIASPSEILVDNDLKAFTDAVFTARMLRTARLLSDVAGDNGDKFWRGSMLDEQWDSGSRDERETALTTAMQFQNALDQAEYDDPQFLVMHAAMRLKALLLALGCDAVYGTDLVKRIATDPMQFGVHNLAGAGGE
jgi:hypothetical protein